jgi:hypothetical protein
MGSKSKYRGRPSVPFQQQVKGGVALDQMAAQKQQQELAVRARVEGLAAAIYASNVDLNGDDGITSECVQASIDKALDFAREVWGIQGQRVSPAVAQEGAEPPSPIIEG